MDYIATIMDYITYAFAAAVTLHDGTINALTLSQYAVHGPANSMALFNRLEVMKEVAKKNDPDVEVDVLPLSDDFMGFTQRYTSKEERKRMGQVVSDDRDAFLQSRNWDFDLLLSAFGCSVGPAIRKRGSTELIELTDGWKSMDTLSYHNYWIKVKWSGISCKHSETPIGYGSAFSAEGLDDSAYTYADSRSTNPNASSYAESNVANGFEPYSLTGGAIPEFYDLSEDAIESSKEDPRTTLAIRVTKAAGKQRYSGGASDIKPAGVLDIYDGKLANDESAAISRVEVYFERPDGKNPLYGQEEYGNLFNPYWQVRLSPITASERALAQLKQGLQLP